MRASVAAMTVALLVATAVPASAGESSEGPVRFDRVVPTGPGTFHTCDDGTVITFEATSYRAYTQWFDDAGVLVREHRHLTFDGTLSALGVSVPYLGVWNREQDFVTDEIRITGGQLRVPLPGGRMLVGAGLRADGNEFVGSGDRFLVDLCAAFDELAG